ncbi:MAG: threonine synthase [archaeon]
MLICPVCSKEYPDFRYFCDCGSVLLWEGPELSFKPFFSLGEGNTPLVERKDVKAKEFLKYEGENPTGSFKDRGSSFVISHAYSLGYKKIVCASTGNMGASVAAYSAYANLYCKIFVPKNTPLPKISQIKAYGADIVFIDGSFSDCVKAALREKDAYIAMSGINPFYLEGIKKISVEIEKKIGVPDNVFVPMGTGGLLTAIWKGFKKKKPRMFGVQPEGCSAIVDYVNTGILPKIENPKSVASALLAKDPVNYFTAAKAIKETNGKAVKVSDEEIIHAVHELGLEGIFAEPAGAAGLAGKNKLNISKKEKTVIIVSGSGLKQPVI